MGVVNSGIPKGIAVELAAAVGATAFIETGTYRGDTTRWAAAHFASVYTIERSKTLYQQFSAELARLPGVEPLLGDSRAVLPVVTEKLGATPAMVWLDGHWSGGETGGVNDECPVLDELSSLSRRTSDIVLIDDARFFLSAPPRPHNASQWPTIVEVVAALNQFAEARLVQVLDDVIFAVPKTSAAGAVLTEYAQARAASIGSNGQTQPVGSRLYRWFRRRLTRPEHR